MYMSNCTLMNKIIMHVHLLCVLLSHQGAAKSYVYKCTWAIVLLWINLYLLCALLSHQGAAKSLYEQFYFYEFIMHTYEYIIHPHFLKKRINMSTFDEKVYKYKLHAYMWLVWEPAAGEEIHKRWHAALRGACMHGGVRGGLRGIGGKLGQVH